MKDGIAARSRMDWLGPSWRRIGGAGLVAVICFFLPQEVPLVWHPLNHPGPDILYLEITCASDKAGDVQVFYNTTGGINQLESIFWSLSPTTQPYTYTFPLPDAPITELRLDPIAAGGSLIVRKLRIIDRRGMEIRRFVKDDVVPVQQIAGVMALPDGWKIVSETNANDPFARLTLPTPILAHGLNQRNLLRCLYSWGYLALMIWILLLAVLIVFNRHRIWRDGLTQAAFCALLALMFSAAGNRGLIRNSIHYARFVAPPITPGLGLEIDLTIDQPVATAQIFWDRGNGFAEADSARCGYERHRELQTLRFSLPAGPLRALRFDPLDGPAGFVVRGLRIVDTARQTRAILPLGSLQAAQEIARQDLSAEAMSVRTQEDAHDPILQFSPAAVSAINEMLTGPP